MKTSVTTSSRARGSILVVTLAVSAIIGISLASYLTLVSSQHRATVRSQYWNASVPLVEAGIEEALAHLNKNCVPNSIHGKPVNFTADGWTSVAGGVRMVRQLADGFYDVTILTAKPLTPEIVAVGNVTTPLASKGGVQAFFATVGAETPTTYLTRNIFCTTTNLPVFTKALVARGTINLAGNNVVSDSYDSSDATKSNNGRYDKEKRGEKGDIASNLTITNSVDVGNANIYGKASTGPGGTIAMGPNGAVGSRVWNDSGKKGIQTGWSTDDMNVSFPSVQSPFAAALPPTGGLHTDGVIYDYILSSGNWLITSPNEFEGKVLVTGDAVLRVDSKIEFSGSEVIIIQTNASLKLYANCQSASISGNGIVNKAGKPKNFAYFGMPANTSLRLTGNAEFAGTIYAPEADLQLGGSGAPANGFDFSGSAVVNTAQLNGHFNIHYDENLGINSMYRGFVITSWQEK